MSVKLDETFMQLALAQARLAGAAGEVPVGAVLVCNGQVVATGRNAAIQDCDPCAHAEIMALRAAAQQRGNYRLEDCDLYVTLEPCAMCSGAMLHARLRRVVFAAPDPKTGAAGSVLNLFAIPALNHQTQAVGGILATESGALLQDFFRQRRSERTELARHAHPLRDDALRTPDAAFVNLPDYPWAGVYRSDLPALGGLRMHYLDLGALGAAAADADARTYICLHGRSRWSYQYRHLIPALLAAGHRVLAPDLIGFGKSDKPKKVRFHQAALHQSILHEWVEALHLQRVVWLIPAQDALPVLPPPSVSDLGHWRVSLQTLAQTRAAGLCQAAYRAPFPDAGHQAAERAWPCAAESDGAHGVHAIREPVAGASAQLLELF